MSLPGYDRVCPGIRHTDRRTDRQIELLSLLLTTLHQELVFGMKIVRIKY